jgi:hypothetical protein
LEAELLRGRWLWIAVGLLLIYFAVRLASLTAFPSFVDEAFHINFGRDVLATGPFAHAEEGRQFVVWLYMLFGAQGNAPLWTARTANLLTLVVGAAALIGAARLLANRWSAVFVALLLIFSPYHHFFERLALADPVSGAAVTLAVYFAARLRRRASPLDAALCGAALFLACGAKVSALPYFCIPVIAVLTLRPTRAGIRWGAVALVVGLALTGAYLGVLYWRGYNPFFYLETGRRAPLAEVLSTNLGNTFGTLSGYLSLPLALLLLAAVALLVLRRRFFLPLILLLPLAVMWLSSRQDSRHLFAPISLLLLGGALALGEWIADSRQLIAAVAALLIVGALLWMPFAQTLVNNPAALPVPADDRAEYMTSEGSGFGLAEVIAALKERQPTRVIGILANCLSLRNLAPFPVECPRLNPNGDDVDVLAALLASSSAAGTYAVLEAVAYAPSSAPGSLLTVIDVGRPRLSIYDLAP